MFEISNRTSDASERKHIRFRKSGQALMPNHLSAKPATGEGYDLYPCHSLGGGKIQNGYASLAQWISRHPAVVVEGFSGVLWADVQSCLSEELAKLGVPVKWVESAAFLKPVLEIQALVAPFLGERDSVWGRKTDLKLQDFFDFSTLTPEAGERGECQIFIGPGASLLHAGAPVIYLDVPKNEIQYRMRAGSVTNLGMSAPDEPAQMYKQYYFVDWVVLNAHKTKLANRILIQGDVQWKSNINWMFREDLERGLAELATSVLRVRPWFEPGAWGGHWMQERIRGLNKAEVNYAWSFELIVPENGVVFESDGYLLEVPFDLLMLHDNQKVLGKHAAFFGTEFPIRFDFLDTWEGGNLSIQCHPSLRYIRENFGERITQDETYYILDCKKGAKVYLGFQEGVDPDEFRTALEESKATGKEVDVDRYVQNFEAQKHDLFLIPNGTVHSAGADNLVLEISSTPYIFTFKMYDWLRLDLNGEPRAINIEHAYKNLRFQLQGERVNQELISKPALLEQNGTNEVWHLPTHADHFYDVHRLHFDDRMTVPANGSCQVLMLVEGEAVEVETGGKTTLFRFAETFVIPAAAGSFTLINKGRARAKVVKAFIKDSIDHLTF